MNETIHFFYGEEEPFAQAAALRVEVFVDEQGFAPEAELDGRDADSWHLLVLQDGTPAAVARAFSGERSGEYVIGRVAVGCRLRGRGLGARLMELLEERLRGIGAAEAVLHAQLQAADFYRKLGYLQEGGVFDEEGCPHVMMRKPLVSRFLYGETELRHLCRNDPVLGGAIGKIGPVCREVIPDLFEALAHAIVGQQISSAAHRSVWRQLREAAGGKVTPQAIADMGEKLGGVGISGRKTGYLRGAADAVLSGALNLEELPGLPDEEVCRRLTALDGVGRWTAEMLLIFSMQRLDVLSYGDFGIRRGMRMLYRIPELTRERFDELRQRYSPYATVAGLYLWAIAGGALGKLDDPGADRLKQDR